MNTDQIIILDDGKVHRIGTHAELPDLSGNLRLTDERRRRKWQ